MWNYFIFYIDWYMVNLIYIVFTSFFFVNNFLMNNILLFTMILFIIINIKIDFKYIFIIFSLNYKKFIIIIYIMFINFNNKNFLKWLNMHVFAKTYIFLLFLLFSLYSRVYITINYFKNLLKEIKKNNYIIFLFITYIVIWLLI